jgi:murein DD-endopeptidase MepM/ murein hydrolase activator NlpD
MLRKQRVWMVIVAVIAMVVACPAADRTDAELNGVVRLYSTQQIVSLNVNETYTFKLKSGSARVIRLVSVQEHRDSVIDLMRRAEVRLEIDGRPQDLVCEPYTMPTEAAGLHVLVDSTAGWKNIPKQVQLSLWDASDPIVDPKSFGFPLLNYRLLSHGTQASNEPVYLGAGDGDPQGQKFYHDYGFDTGGFEGRQEVVSSTEGKIVMFWPSREDLCSVVVQDENGFLWEYAHLYSVAPEITLNTHVRQGQKIGILGKSGPSGNFSHLHLGSYLSRNDLDTGNMNRRLNLYPWMVAAYQAQHPTGLLAVARPHHTVLAGEKVVLDGGHSLAWGGSRIVKWRWILPDGRTVKQAVAETEFARPGAYVATLWVKDNQGNEDVDFCQIKVFSRANPEKGMPHIYLSYTPTEDIRPGQPVRFRGWFQGKGGSGLKVDFGDGTRLADYQEYAEVQHSFKTPGVHIVTAQGEAGGRPITQRIKVVVIRPPAASGVAPR